MRCSAASWWHCALGLLVSVCAVLGGVAPAAAGPTTEVLVVTGDGAPDGNGVFDELETPVVNEIGQLAFVATFSGTAGGTDDDRGIVLGSGAPWTQIVREGDAAPDGNGTVAFFRAPAVNDDGQVAFGADYADTSGYPTVDDREGLARGAGGPLTRIARLGENAPDGNGVFSWLPGATPMNDLGQCGFVATFDDTTGGSADDSALLRSDGGAVVTIAREGDGAPDGNGTFSQFTLSEGAALNDAGQVTFRVTFAGTAGGSSDDKGVIRGDDSPPVQIAREGGLPPDGNGTYRSLDPPVINSSGQVAFRATFNGTAGGAGDDTAIVRTDGAAGTVLLREGTPAPDGDGTFSLVGSGVALNDAGQAAFTGRIDDTSDGTDDYILVRADGTSVTRIVRQGQEAPDDDGIFDFLGAPALNGPGQCAFLGYLDDTDGGSSDDEGLYFWDETLGLLQVARTGDAFGGSTITDLNFASNAGGGDDNSGLTDAGQVAYAYRLANKTEGIALWTVPEPATVALLAPAALALLRRRRR